MPIWKRISDGRSSIILSQDLAAWRGPKGYVDNVAHGIALALSDRAIGRVYNLCQERYLTEFEWHKKIAKQTNWHGKLVVLAKDHTPRHLVIPGNFAQHIVASSERIREELGYEELVPGDEAIRRTISWLEMNPPQTTNPWQFDYEAEDRALAQAA